MSETLITIGNKNFCKICESSLCINKDSEYFQRCNNTECDCDCEIIITCEGCNNEFTEDMIVDWDDQLCEDCHRDKMADMAEQRYDRD